VAIWIWWIANGIASEQNTIAINQVSIMDDQTAILETQTDILRKQADIENNSLEFEKHKFGSEIAKANEDKMNTLFDKIMGWDDILTKVHEKIRDGNEVKNMTNLDRYVSEFEEIGWQYCNGSVQKSDLIRILKNQIQYTCGNKQIFFHYQNTKSGLSWLCKALFPGSTVMAKYANPNKCLSLKK
jgi:hypothetical protein